VRVVLVAESQCVECGLVLAAGAEAVFEPERGHLCAVCCPPVAAARSTDETRLLEGPVIGTAGASAAREYRRRRAKREEHVKQRLGKTLGGLYLALSEEPRSTRAWATGNAGERAVGDRLDARAGADFVVLHDRKIPGTRANIDHIVVTHDAVFVVDAKRYRGEVKRINRGNFLFPDHRLYVGRRDCSKLIDGALWQAKNVRRALGTSATPECPIIPILCFVAAEWPLTAGPLRFEAVRVVWSRGLVKLIDKIKTDARLHSIQLAADLSRALPAA